MVSCKWCGYSSCMCCLCLLSFSPGGGGNIPDGDCIRWQVHVLPDLPSGRCHELAAEDWVALRHHRRIWRWKQCEDITELWHWASLHQRQAKGEHRYKWRSVCEVDILSGRGCKKGGILMVKSNVNVLTQSCREIVMIFSYSRLLCTHQKSYHLHSSNRVIHFWA